MITYIMQRGKVYKINNSYSRYFSMLRVFCHEKYFSAYKTRFHRRAKVTFAANQHFAGFGATVALTVLIWHLRRIRFDIKVAKMSKVTILWYYFRINDDGDIFIWCCSPPILKYIFSYRTRLAVYDNIHTKNTHISKYKVLALSKLLKLLVFVYVTNSLF